MSENKVTYQAASPFAGNVDATRYSELVLVGAVLQDPTLYEELRDYIKPETFYWTPFANAWQAIDDLYESGRGIDVITVGDILDRKNQLDDFTVSGKEIGNYLTGRMALSEIRRRGETRNVMTYAANVVDYSAKRILLKEFSIGATHAMNGRSAEDIMRDTIKRLSEIRTMNARVNKHTQSLFDALEDASDRTDAASNGDMIAIPTGIKDLDRALDGGLYAPDLITIAGRPGTGKTAFLVGLAIHSGKLGKRVLFLSLEMANPQIAMRIITQESGVAFGKQRSGKMSESEWNAYYNGKAAAEQYAENIILNDLPAITPSGVRQELRRAGDVDLVILDYVQLAGSDDVARSRVLELGKITMELKGICKTFNVPIVMGAQLSRSIENRKNKRPSLADLRESGSIENDSDIVAFLYKTETATGIENAIILGKNRNGAQGEIPVVFLPERMQFKDLAYSVRRDVV